MNITQTSTCKAFLLATMLVLVACSDEQVPLPAVTDAELQAQIAAALSIQPDLPAPLQVAVNAGRVTISGSLVCADCAGQETPGNFGSVQQSIGAVVRAVPGVLAVEFALTTAP